MDFDIDVADWKERILILMRFLISFGFEDMLGSIISAQDALDGPSDDVTVAGSMGLPYSLSSQDVRNLEGGAGQYELPIFTPAGNHPRKSAPPSLGPGQQRVHLENDL